MIYILLHPFHNLLLSAFLCEAAKANAVRLDTALDAAGLSNDFGLERNAGCLVVGVSRDVKDDQGSFRHFGRLEDYREEILMKFMLSRVYWVW